MSDNPTVTYPDMPVDEPANDDDLTALLAKRQHARPNRLTWVLLTLLVLVIGFIGGAFANQKFGTASSSTSRIAGFPTGFPGVGAIPGVGAFPGAGQAGGGSTTTPGGPAGGFGNATFGTVKLVDGTNLYITNAAGETVKVKVPATATITSQQTVALSDLPSGATVIIQETRPATAP